MWRSFIRRHFTFLVVFFMILLVQTIDSAETKRANRNNKNVINPSQKGVSLDAFLQSKLDKLEAIVSNNDINNNKKHFSNKKRFLGEKSAPQMSYHHHHTTSDPTLAQLNQVLSKFLKKNRIHKRDITGLNSDPLSIPNHIHWKRSDKNRNEGDHNKDKLNQKWDNWTEWSSCSVSCGKGRHIRWRHCLDNCDHIETEMQEKGCQLPACPQKLFGILKL